MNKKIFKNKKIKMGCTESKPKSFKDPEELKENKEQEIKQKKKTSYCEWIFNIWKML